MRTRVLQLNLDEPIMPVPHEAGYAQYRILVKKGPAPLGWISLPQSEGQIEADVIRAAIAQQLAQRLTETEIMQGWDHEVPAPMPSISVVVCTRNRARMLVRCLAALTMLDYPSFEIIVVDNAPSDNKTIEATAEFPVRYVREGRPGLDHARNRGIAEARNEIVAFTDDDALADAGWLRAIGKIFQHPQVMGASGYVGPAELETEAQHRFELEYGGMGHGFRRRAIHRSTLTPRELLWASGFGIGANMAFRRSLFAQTGGFDVTLDVGTPSHGGGDIEFFHRMVAQGHLFLYEPEMIVWHHHRREDRGLERQAYDNGRSFGCYLIQCFQKKTVRRTDTVLFFFREWLWRRQVKNFLSLRPVAPRKLLLAEIRGMISSPAAYYQTKRKQGKNG